MNKEECSPSLSNSLHLSNRPLNLSLVSAIFATFMDSIEMSSPSRMRPGGMSRRQSSRNSQGAKSREQQRRNSLGSLKSARDQRKVNPEESEQLSRQLSRTSTRSKRRTPKWWKIRLFRGMIQDVKRRAPYYWSDYRDAFDYRVIPATVYMYFAK